VAQHLLHAETGLLGGWPCRVDTSAVSLPRRIVQCHRLSSRCAAHSLPVADQLAAGVCVQQPIYLYIYYQIQESLSTKYLHVRQFLNIRDIAMEASTGLIELYRGDNPTVEYVIHLSRHANLLTRSPALLQFTA
jgi:hypothetical protein